MPNGARYCLSCEMEAWYADCHPPLDEDGYAEVLRQQRADASDRAYLHSKYPCT